MFVVAMTYDNKNFPYSSVMIVAVSGIRKRIDLFLKYISLVKILEIFFWMGGRQLAEY